MACHSFHERRPLPAHVMRPELFDLPQFLPRRASLGARVTAARRSERTTTGLPLDHQPIIRAGDQSTLDVPAASRVWRRATWGGMCGAGRPVSAGWFSPPGFRRISLPGFFGDRGARPRLVASRRMHGRARIGMNAAACHPRGALACRFARRTCRGVMTGRVLHRWAARRTVAAADPSHAVPGHGGGRQRDSRIGRASTSSAGGLSARSRCRQAQEGDRPDVALTGDQM